MEGHDRTATDDDFRVTVSGEGSRFSSAHFITYGGDQCESLHGHDYRVEVTLAGGLNRDAYVYDFVELRERLSALLSELDHRVLLPEDNPALRIHRGDGAVRVSVRDREYRFPRSDVVLLPVRNTTAEQLAEYLGDRIADALRDPDEPAGLSAMSVEVEEAPGQSARHTRSLADE